MVSEQRAANGSPTPAIIQISTAAAVLRQLPRFFFEGTGSLAANQQTDVAANFRKVAAVEWTSGSSVRRGQMLIRLADADFKDRAQQAQAQLDEAKATLRQNEAKID